MPPRSKETPRERYKSDPLTEQERHDLPIKLAEAIASGPPIMIDPGLSHLAVQVFSASMTEDGDIMMSMRVTGFLKRASKVATCKGKTINVVIPAKMVQEDDS